MISKISFTHPNLEINYFFPAYQHLTIESWPEGQQQSVAKVGLYQFHSIVCEDYTSVDTEELSWIEEFG